MLGPLEDRVGSGELLEVGGARLRTLLIMLALRPAQLVSRTVTPVAVSLRTTSHISLRLRGSSPVVGSSRYSTRGRPTRLAARSSRRRMPPE